MLNYIQKIEKLQFICSPLLLESANEDWYRLGGGSLRKSLFSCSLFTCKPLKGQSVQTGADVYILHICCMFCVFEHLKDGLSSK